MLTENAEQVLERLRNANLPNTEVMEVKLEYGKLVEAKSRQGNWKFENLPAFYRISLKMTPGERSLIYTEVWLPLEWNGIFVGSGNNGIAGSLYHPWLNYFLKNHYATANTDMGTSAGWESGCDNPDMWNDFGWRATHEMTVVTKLLIELCYGRKPDYSYFMGGSTGGNQAMMEAQRFPEDYDSIFCFVPAHERLYGKMLRLWLSRHERAADGTPLFTKEQIREITAQGVAFYQSQGDGQPGDNFITLPAADAETVDAFIAWLGVHMPELTRQQLEALRAIYIGPINALTGERICKGIPIGSESMDGGISAESGKNYTDFVLTWTFGADYDSQTFDFGADWDTVQSRMSAILDAHSVALEPFFDRGGKLVIYAGSADPRCTFYCSMDYYDRLLEHFGGYEKLKDHCRFFLMPGRSHGGGDGTQQIWPDPVEGDEFLIIRRWLEEGKAPDVIYAVRPNQTDKSLEPEIVRPLYPYIGNGQFLDMAKA